MSSQSFGFVHETRASKKAYIRARQEMADKEYCLVNIEIPEGEQQTQVMDDLFAKAQEPGWTKETLVAHKKRCSKLEKAVVTNNKGKACEGYQSL